MRAEFRLESVDVLAEGGGEMIAARGGIAKARKIIEHGRKPFPLDWKIDGKQRLPVNRLFADTTLCGFPFSFGCQSIERRQRAGGIKRGGMPRRKRRACCIGMEPETVRNLISAPLSESFHQPVVRRGAAPVGEREF